MTMMTATSSPWGMAFALARDLLYDCRSIHAMEPRMREDTGHLIDDLQQLVSEFEKLVRAARGAVSDHGDDVAEQVRESLGDARDRLAAGARAFDGYLRDNTWAALAVTTAAAFMVGVLLARRK
jgi:ElaB/YqjD/DUF883 family membrane-anchored ribosome-binding protein